MATGTSGESRPFFETPIFFFSTLRKGNATPYFTEFLSRLDSPNQNHGRHTVAAGLAPYFLHLWSHCATFEESHQLKSPPRVIRGALPGFPGSPG